MISFRCHNFLKMYIFQPINNSVQDSFIAVDNNDTWRSLFQTPPPVSTCHCYVVYTYVMHLWYFKSGATFILDQLNRRRIMNSSWQLYYGINANYIKTVTMFLSVIFMCLNQS